MKLGNYIQLISGQHIDVVNCNKDNLGIPYLTGPADFIGKIPKPSKFTNQPKVICEKGDILVTVKESGTINFYDIAPHAGAWIETSFF